MSYFEPNEAPKEVIERKATAKRTIRIRFDCKEDVDDFISRTGINLPHRSAYKIEYPERDVFSFLEE